MKHKTILIWLVVLISIFGCRIGGTDVTSNRNIDHPDIPPVDAKTSRIDPLVMALLDWSPPMAPDIYYTSYDENSFISAVSPDPALQHKIMDLLTLPPVRVDELVFRIDPARLEPFRPQERDLQQEAWLDIERVSHDRFFTAHFSNDVMLSIDYYYTNGIRFDYIAPNLANSPFEALMIPYRHNSINYHGITLVQDFFTPVVLDTTAVQQGDRPFAGVLYAGQFKMTLDPGKKYKQVTEFDLGVIGPESLGGFVQANIHETKPTGWVNQVQSDIVINYHVGIEKGIINNNHFDFNAVVEGNIGSLYSNAGAGFHARAGSFMGYFENIGLAAPGNKGYQGRNNFQYAFTLSSIVRAVAYDATLQGGMFNKKSIYTLDASDISRIVFNTSFGIAITYKFLGFRTEMHYITPEFKGGREHRWLHMAATFRI